MAFSVRNTRWVWKLAPILIVVALRGVRGYIRGSEPIALVVDMGLLVLGWMLGWEMAHGDGLVYALTCDPSDPSCQPVRRDMQSGRWLRAIRAAWSLNLERGRMLVRNVLTLGAMALVGVWLVSSSGSAIASGVVFGLGVRLVTELAGESDYKKWYWVFTRSFSEREHKTILMILGLAMLVQMVMLARR